MGDDDKRELLPNNRTILHGVAEIDLARRFGAGRPHRSLRAGPSAAAGTSMNRKPAACASVAVNKRASVIRNPRMSSP